jgi:hypothetical protein
MKPCIFFSITLEGMPFLLSNVIFDDLLFQMFFISVSPPLCFFLTNTQLSALYRFPSHQTWFLLMVLVLLRYVISVCQPLLTDYLVVSLNG